MRERKKKNGDLATGLLYTIEKSEGSMDDDCVSGDDKLQEGGNGQIMEHKE